MKITDIDTLMIDSPGRKWTIVRVHTDEGITGLGEATYSLKEPVVCAAVDHMKQELLGHDPARIEYLWHHIYKRSSPSGIWRMAGPVWMSALAGIDIALWDIKGKVASPARVRAPRRRLPRGGGRVHPLGRLHPRGGGGDGEGQAGGGLLRAEGGRQLAGPGRPQDWDTYLDDGHPEKTAAPLRGRCARPWAPT